MATPRLFLIDAHALCYRSFFAIRELRASNGQATNAVYGFVNTLRKIIRDYSPEYIAVCFDVGKKTRRQEKFAEYKIQRPSMPDDLISQIPIIKEVVRAYNLPVFELEGYEADDLIATIVNRCKKDKLEVVIVSDDKDMYQLVDKNTKMFSVRKDMFLTAAESQKRFGVDPKHITDYIALAGDTADNIPGVSGIGEVTARKLITEYGGLDEIYKHLDDIASKSVKAKLAADKEMAFFSKELAELECSVPIKCQLADMKRSDPQFEKLYTLFKELEFKKFAQEFASQVADSPTVEVETLKDVTQVKDFIKKIQKQGVVAFSIDDGDTDEPTLLPHTLYCAGGDGAVFRISDAHFNSFKDVLVDPAVTKVTYDVKEQAKIVTGHQLEIAGPVFDVLLAAYLLAPSKPSYDIATLSWDYLELSPADDAGIGTTVAMLAKLYPILDKELGEKSLSDLFSDIEIPLAFVLAEMESKGVRLDLKLLKELSAECEKKISGLVAAVYKEAGEEFNLNSPKQLSAVLFEKLELPVIRKTKTGFSTDENVLKKLADQHPVPRLILEYRQLSKLKSTYIDALPRLVNSQSGRVHTTFNQIGTETGRLSSNNPNLQNIPIRTEEGRKIRRAFIPLEAKHCLVSADYSQIELRILAHLSKDTGLKKAFTTGQDIHTYTASLIFEVDEKDVTKDMRNNAKRVNFGIVYGMSAFGLSKDLKIPQYEAQEFIDKYFLRYPAVKKFMDATIKECASTGYVLTLLNRRRYIPEINSDNGSVKQFAERQAINTPVQGSAADLLKIAMIHIQKEISAKKLKSSMLITVHDELVFDVYPDELDEMITLIRTKMEQAVALDVPVDVIVKTGANWLDMKEV